MKFRVTNKNQLNYGQIGIAVEEVFCDNYDYYLRFDYGLPTFYFEWELERVKELDVKNFVDYNRLNTKTAPTNIKANTDLLDSSIYAMCGMRKYLLPTIKEVISNPPTTVVGFADGTHIKSVASKGDKYDLNKGIMVCIIKHMYGLTNSQFRKMFNDIKDNKLIVHKKRVKKTVDKKVKE